ncbi:MAG: helix-turn-helix transcriptional regulator, partial [Segetibacter sp.]|nr:helix-turn-helix transcriptional regulator [Segetibacter sp.]
MLKPLEILKVANQATIDPSLDLLFQKEQTIPGSIQYSIKRYYNQFPQGSEDTG